MIDIRHFFITCKYELQNTEFQYYFLDFEVWVVKKMKQHDLSVENSCVDSRLKSAGSTPHPLVDYGLKLKMA